MDEPTTTTGPAINGQPSIIALLTSEQLKKYPHLRALRLFINEAFESNHSGPAANFLFPYDSPRLGRDNQLSDELGPDAFTFIVSSMELNNVDTPQLYACVSGRPLALKETKVLHDMQRTKAPIDLEHYEAWEIKTLAVNPTIQRQGLGSLLVGLVETEVVKRGVETGLQGLKMKSQSFDSTPRGMTFEEIEITDGAMRKPVALALSGCREVIEAWYRGRGFVTTEILPMRKGTGGTTRDWEICFKQKDVKI
ncbi:hypothetical protein FRB98_006113 [Tulasnella sp. 332]|nr:hypothetical protein FRB98_006113 [Tulasnella sp. 332]